MPSGSVTPAGGGTAFNGGTITNKLAVSTTANTAEPLIAATAPVGFNANANPPDLLRLTAEDGTAILTAEDGSVALLAGTGSGQGLLTVGDVTNVNRAVSIGSADGVSISGNSAYLTIQDESSVVRFQVSLTGTVTATGRIAAAGAKLNPITSGALSTTTFVSGTGKQIELTRDVFLVVPCTLNPTAGAAGTVAVALSPDNSTYSTLVTITEPAGIAFDGTIIPASLQVPTGWYVKLIATNATIGTATYY
jgi:hypothetical protein